ncbi:mating-type switching protein Swi10 [Geopyxis carbonaria]|nr:mating-type switching protein Swi10 [Geopyxis carbonaria]
MDHDDNDDFDQIASDAAFAAALEAAERSYSANANKRPAPTSPPTAGASVTVNRQATASSSSAPPPAPQQQQKPPVKQPVPTKVARGGTSSIIVSTKQRGNPVLNHIKNVAWEYGSIIPDYLVGASTCALFLSLKYHKLHPDYVYTRIKALGDGFKLRILLILVDINDHADSLRELTKVSVVSNMTNIVAWSSQEVGRYLETFKSYEGMPPTSIMEKRSEDYATRVTEMFTTVRSVNKTDSMNLLSNFGSVRAAINAHPEEIMMLPGWGQQKVTRFERTMHEPFIINTKKKPAATATKSNPPPPSASTDPAIAARLGIGPVSIQAKAPTPQQPEDPSAESYEIDPDEEDALAAVEAEEAASLLRGRTTTLQERSPPPKSLSPPPAPTGDAATTSIMDALAKFREEQ